MNLSAPFITRPVMTTFVMLALLLAGWIAFLKLPVSDLPPLEFPMIQVTAGYAGANPETILHELTVPLERELTQVKGVREIRSSSDPGRTLIQLFFEYDREMKAAASDVQAALNRASPFLPRDVDPRPSYERMEASQEPIMYLILTGDNSNIGELRRYADTYITPRLSRIEGVAKAEVYGSANSLWVRLNPELMAARHIGFNQVMDTIREHTAQMPLGSIQTSGQRLTLELSGAVKQAKDLENLEIGHTHLRLRDIAEIDDRAAQDAEVRFVTAERSQLALILAIQRISGANTIAISQAMQQAVEAMQKELPPSMHLLLWFDKAIWIQESIRDVEWSLLFAFLLVVLVIYLTLGRVREALIPSVTLPLALIGTFLAMHLLHFGLDLLSLLALTLCVGFVVDDAIVVLENIVRHHEQGMSRFEACMKGSKEICFTIVSMTLSLVAVFIPLLFMPGLMGQIFREFSVTLAVAILVSGFVSLTLTPMLCNRLLPITPSSVSGLQKWVHVINNRLLKTYAGSLKGCLRYPKTVLLVALGCVVISLPLFSRLTVNLIPQEDRGYLFVFMRLPPGISSLEVKGYQDKLEAALHRNPSVDSSINLVMAGDLIAFVRLHPLPQRPPIATIVADVEAKLNDIPGIVPFVRGYQLINTQFSFGEGGDFEYVIKGMDFASVEGAAQQLAAALRTQPEYSFVGTSQTGASPKLVVDIDEQQARKLGLSKQTIQALLQSAYGQGQVGTIQNGSNPKRIFMELQTAYQSDRDALAKLSVSNDQGMLVPLRAVAKWSETLGYPSLLRREQFPTASVRFSLAADVAQQKGLQKLEEVAAQVLPPSVFGSFDHSADEITSTLLNTLFLLIAAVVVMYIVLGILYESFIHPLTILSSLPFAGLGGVLTLILFQEPLSIFSVVGFLLLIGIVKKNGIMMIDYALEAKKRGLNSQDAMFEGALVRFRPIMMTTLAAMMGALPIAIGIGEGAAMHRGLGLVIVGGLLFSQLLTLYITPVLYLMFERATGRRLQPRCRETSGQPAPLPG